MKNEFEPLKILVAVHEKPSESDNIEDYSITQIDTQTLRSEVLTLIIDICSQDKYKIFNLDTLTDLKRVVEIGHEFLEEGSIKVEFLLFAVLLEFQSEASDFEQHLHEFISKLNELVQRVNPIISIKFAIDIFLFADELDEDEGDQNVLYNELENHDYVQHIGFTANDINSLRGRIMRLDSKWNLDR